jgi:hypothetical protein
MGSTDAGLTLGDSSEYFSFTRRFFAWCVDMPTRFIIGLALIFLPMRFMLLVQSKRYGSTNPTVLWNVMCSAEKNMIFMFWLLAVVIIPWLYTVLQERLCGASNPWQKAVES